MEVYYEKLKKMGYNICDINDLRACIYCFGELLCGPYGYFRFQGGNYFELNDDIIPVFLKLKE